MLKSIPPAKESDDDAMLLEAPCSLSARLASASWRCRPPVDGDSSTSRRPTMLAPLFIIIVDRHDSRGDKRWRWRSRDAPARCYRPQPLPQLTPERLCARRRFAPHRAAGCRGAELERGHDSGHRVSRRRYTRATPSRPQAPTRPRTGPSTPAAPSGLAASKARVRSSRSSRRLTMSRVGAGSPCRRTTPA